MKIEKGRFYKTREGEKVTIYKTDCISIYPIHGSISVCGKDQVSTWTQPGKYSTANDNSVWDIISEWAEPEAPKPRTLAYCNRTNGILFLSTDPKEFEHMDRAPWLDEPEAT